MWKKSTKQGPPEVGFATPLGNVRVLDGDNGLVLMLDNRLLCIVDYNRHRHAIALTAWPENGMIEINRGFQRTATVDLYTGGAA